MPKLKLFRIALPFITLAWLLSFFLQSGHNAARQRFDPGAYIERGDQVEKRYDAYGKRLAKYYATLIAAVKEHAPDLLVHLQPRQPILHGYQVLPHIVLDAPVEKRPHTVAVAYSWPWTDRLIDNELGKLTHSEADLRGAVEMTGIDRTAMLERLARDYGQQSRRLRNIHAHVQYNRLWQAAIAGDRLGYDRETALFSHVVERERVIDRLNRVHPKFETAAFDAPLGVAELAGGLRKRVALLDRRIDHAIDQVEVPAFVKLKRLGGEWIFQVPLFTDIEDREYVSAIKQIIENTWQLKDRSLSYRVEIDITHVTTEALYLDMDKPSPGQKIETRRHLKRFPSGAAILTTGALTTHVQNHAIVLGPHPIAPQVLAHEFGHILGFRDRYVRGYKDLGEHGFQVMEVVADRDDIMAATAQGTVQRSHFLKLLDGRARPEPVLRRDYKLISG